MKNELKEISAQRLSECMAEYNHGVGITAAELVKKVGEEITKSNISQYLSGTHSPSNKKAGAIANVFGVNPVWLMGFDVMKYTPDIEVVSYTIYSPEDREIFDELQTMSIKEKRHIIDYIRAYKTMLRTQTMGE